MRKGRRAVEVLFIAGQENGLRAQPFYFGRRVLRVMLDKVELHEDAGVKVFTMLNELPGHAQAGDLCPQPALVNEVGYVVDQFQFVHRQLIGHGASVATSWNIVKSGL